MAIKAGAGLSGPPLGPQRFTKKKLRCRLFGHDLRDPNTGIKFHLYIDSAEGQFMPIEQQNPVLATCRRCGAEFRRRDLKEVTRW